MQYELKECPFCKSDDNLAFQEYDPEIRMTEAIYCDQCNLEFYKFDSESTEEFVARWNDR